jgi:carbon monoxide dehydrogenase subunit G
MTTVERDIFINASIDEIDAIALDGYRLPEWFAGVEKAEPDDIYPEVGGQVRLVYKAAGLKFNITMTTEELERGYYAIFRLEGMMTGTHRWEHTPEDDGTRTRVRFDYETSGGVFGQVVDQLIVQRMNTRNLETSLENLKALAEG